MLSRKAAFTDDMVNVNTVYLHLFDTFGPVGYLINKVQRTKNSRVPYADKKGSDSLNMAMFASL